MGFVEKNGDTVIRSFKLDKAMEAELEVEADKQGKSFSRLMENIVENYLNHYRYLDKRNALTILPETMMAFLEHLDEDELSRIGDFVGANIPRQAYLMKGVPFDEETALDHLVKILGDYDKWYRVSYHDDNRPYLYIQNQLGSKWIAFIEAYVRAFYASLGIAVECQRVDDNLQVLLKPRI
jgi:hypothetical protein